MAPASESSLSGFFETGDSTTHPFRSKPDLLVLTEFFDEMQDQVLFRIQIDKISKNNGSTNSFKLEWYFLLF
jgi:hypothetical protein